MQTNDLSQFFTDNVIEGEKRFLLQTIADHPDRYNTSFYVSHPEGRLLQTILQLREQRFSDAMREIVKMMLIDLGFSILPAKVQDAEGNDLAVDPHFASGRAYYYLEWRLRDDLEASKRRSLLNSLRAKVDALYRLHGERLVIIVYFLDPILVKHRGTYTEEIAQLRKDYAVDFHIFYGPEFFTYLGQPTLWGDLLGWLRMWKTNLPKLPELNYDQDPDSTFAELASLDARYWWSLILEDGLWEQGVLQTLFPEGKTLRLLLEHFEQQTKPPFPLLTRALAARLEKYPTSSQNS
jgi:hypothetical protein